MHVNLVRLLKAHMLVQVIGVPMCTLLCLGTVFPQVLLMDIDILSLSLTASLLLLGYFEEK